MKGTIWIHGTNYYEILVYIIEVHTGSLNKNLILFKYDMFDSSSNGTRTNEYNNVEIKANVGYHNYDLFAQQEKQMYFTTFLKGQRG